MQLGTDVFSLITLYFFVYIYCCWWCKCCAVCCVSSSIFVARLLLMNWLAGRACNQNGKYATFTNFPVSNWCVDEILVQTIVSTMNVASCAFNRTQLQICLSFGCFRATHLSNIHIENHAHTDTGDMDNLEMEREWQYIVYTHTETG